MACPTCGTHLLREGPATPVAIVCDPNNLLGGIGGGTAGLDYETLLLANPASPTEPVVVVNNFNPTTGVYTPVLRNIDGTAYVGATPILPSGASSVPFTAITGCDVVQLTNIWDASNIAVVANTLSFDITDDGASAENVIKTEHFLTTDLLGGVSLESSVTAPFTFSHDFTSQADGDYVLYTTVTYPSGNVFVDKTLDITVASGVPSVTVNHIAAGAHVSTAGTRVYNSSASEVALYSDGAGTLLDIFALPLIAVPVTYVMTGTFASECPQPVVETSEYLVLSNASNLVEKSLCLIDDTLSDGSVLVQFNRIVLIDPITGLIVSSRNYTKDYSAVYTILGTVSLCEDTGTQATLIPRRRYITAGTFTLPTTAQSISIQVKAVGNVITPPTINDGFATTPLFAGDSETWSAQDGSNIILGGTLTLSANAGDQIVVAWTEFV